MKQKLLSILTLQVVCCLLSSSSYCQKSSHSVYVSLPEGAAGYEVDVYKDQHHFLLYAYGSVGFYLNSTYTGKEFIPVVLSFNPLEDFDSYVSFGLRYYLPKTVWPSPTWESFAQISFDRGGFWNSLRAFNLGFGVEHAFSERTAFFLLNSVGVIPLRQFTYPLSGERMKGIQFEGVTRIGLRYYFLSSKADRD